MRCDCREHRHTGGQSGVLCGVVLLGSSRLSIVTTPGSGRGIYTVKHRKQFRIVQLRKYGSGNCVSVPRQIQDALGWNRDDAMKLDVINGSLVVTKVMLPRATVVRNDAVPVDSATDVQDASDNSAAVTGVTE